MKKQLVSTCCSQLIEPLAKTLQQPFYGDRRALKFPQRGYMAAKGFDMVLSGGSR